MKIEETTEGEYEVSCHLQKVKLEKTRSRYKACFDKKICAGCPTCRRLYDTNSEESILFYNHQNQWPKLPGKKSKRKEEIEFNIFVFQLWEKVRLLLWNFA